ncbi:hypothetical protein BOTNAR_0157g00250 [Botryotinia narcissicola]|uniref:Uncharacterized protein n=1 Tax=Botryotinia narcissicola TaxID=278944 RepID=A0A4Z1IJJ8_9HELO|nr:hypothetical protein BOTNAR_0157g00250 [Botryotinia narcissicola]
MTQNRYPHGVIESASKRSGHPPNSSPISIYCVHCDTQHNPSQFGSPMRGLEFIPPSLTIRSHRPRESYGTGQIKPAES